MDRKFGREKGEWWCVEALGIDRNVGDVRRPFESVCEWQASKHTFVALDLTFYAYFLLPCSHFNIF